MAIKERFDNFLKSLVENNESLFGYVTKDGRVYQNYFNNQEWEEYLADLKSKPNFFFSYSEGDGGELKEKTHKGKYMPPKMCSVASSSRFIYLSLGTNTYKRIKLFDDSLKMNGAFEFEKKLLIQHVNSKANLDGYYREINKALYFEAKCHELFDKHELAWRSAYFTDGVFFGNDKKSLHLSLCDIDTTKEKTKKEYGKLVTYKYLKSEVFNLNDGEKFILDIKQFVCHLLAIANDDSPNKTLIYFYFKPEKLPLCYDSYYQKLEEEFKKFCNSKVISDFCKRNQIETKLVYAINDTMTDELKIKNVFHYKAQYN